MKRLYRSHSERMISGVCGGIAEYFHIDPTLVRIAYVIITFLTAFFPSVVIYFLLAWIIPDEKDLLDK